MFNQKKKIKTWILWAGFILSIIFGILIMIWVNYAKNTSLPLVLMVIDFLIMSSFLQVALSKTFKYKPKKADVIVKEYPLEDFDLIKTNLLKAKFEKLETTYGYVFSQITANVLYKVIIVLDSDKYFNNDSNNNQTASNAKGIENCTGFIGFEIFRELSPEYMTKIADFSFQGEKIYYEGFYYDSINKKIIEANALVPLYGYDVHYEKMMKILNFTIGE